MPQGNSLLKNKLNPSDKAVKAWALSNAAHFYKLIHFSDNPTRPWNSLAAATSTIIILPEVICVVLEPSKHPFVLEEIVNKVDASLHSRQAMIGSFAITCWLQTGPVARWESVSVCSTGISIGTTATATELGAGNSPTRKSDNLASLPHANPNPEESQPGYWLCREDHSRLWIPACIYKNKWHIPIFLYIYHKCMQLRICVLWWLCNCRALFAVLYKWKTVIFCRKSFLSFFFPPRVNI